MSASLRVALVHAAPAPACVRELAQALRAAGHRPRVVAPRPAAVVERVLRARGFMRPLSHLPSAGAALLREELDVVHAFSAQDAAVALAWQRRRGGPVVFTCAEAIDRGTVAHGRLRLRLLEAALRDADAVTAIDAASRDALERWLAVDAALVAPHDAAAHERLYRGLLDRRRPA